MEPVRRAARRLAHYAEIDILQKGEGGGYRELSWAHPIALKIMNGDAMRSFSMQPPTIRPSPITRMATSVALVAVSTASVNWR